LFVKLLHEVEAIYDGSMNYAISKSKHESGLYWCDLRRIDTEFFKTKIIGDKEGHPKILDMNTLAVFA